MTKTANAESKKITIPACPACSHTRGVEYEEADAAGSNPKTFRFVYACGACQGIFSNHLYLGESYEIVLPFMTSESVPEERMRYFDFSGVSSKGPYRRHGWFDVQTKRIVQAG